MSDRYRRDDDVPTEMTDEALREYILRQKVRKLLKFEGKMTWEGDLDELRLRELSGLAIP